MDDESMSEYESQMVYDTLDDLEPKTVSNNYKSVIVSPLVNLYIIHKYVDMVVTMTIEIERRSSDRSIPL